MARKKRTSTTLPEEQIVDDLLEVLVRTLAQGRAEEDDKASRKTRKSASRHNGGTKDSR